MVKLDKNAIALTIKKRKCYYFSSSIDLFLDYSCKLERQKGKGNKKEGGKIFVHDNSTNRTNAEQ